MKPSAWFERHLPPSHCQNGNQAWLMDWACGQGRHSLLALERGWHVLAIDRNEHALEALREAAESLQRSEHLRCLQLDLESDALPSRLSQALAELGLQAVAAIVVSNYLYRLHWKWMLASLRPGGMSASDGQRVAHSCFNRASCWPGRSRAISRCWPLRMFLSATLQGKPQRGFNALLPENPSLQHEPIPGSVRILTFWGKP
ncbi:MAG: class I SAM-dependent methyltransferase [Betaproteobacteria bacterium]|nr:class I SAM-dependent methyltransferase [Betaproteobacteria bacterium]